MNLNKTIAFLFLLPVTVLGIKTAQLYSGNIFYYIGFSVSFTLLLLRGFSKGKSFFDTFIGIFLWLGFWFKYSVRIAFMNGVFGDVGNFNNSPPAHDRALFISTLAALALLLASFIREKFIFSHDRVKMDSGHNGSLLFYGKFRVWIISFFLILATLVPFMNYYLGIYQRGAISRTHLPFGLNGVFTWLVFFGLSSFFAYILNLELKHNKKLSITMMLLGFMEILLSNLSMLSRGMFLNGSALLFGVDKSLKKFGIEGYKKFYMRLGGILFVLIIFSVLSTNIIRMYSFGNQENRASLGIIKNMRDILATSSALIVDRWLGVEGVMAVSSSDKLGMELWKEGWAEKSKPNGTSFYDKVVIKSSYQNADVENHHFITMPGAVGFFFYHGNYYLLFISIFLFGIIAAFIELFVFNLGGNNFILCSLMSQVVAYRFASFGYAPAQSYLLFGTILGNVFIFYFLNKILERYKFKVVLGKNG